MATLVVWPERTRRFGCVCTCVAIGLVTAMACPVAAQETRADEQRREQEAKRAMLVVPAKNGAERLVDRLRQYGLFEDEPVGFYPFIDKIYPSGGLALGGGYRRAFRDTGAVTATTAVSIRNFKSAALNVALPRLNRGRVAIDAALAWMDAPDVPFYGLGADSPRAWATSFGYRPTTVGAALRYEPIKTLTLGGGIEHLRITTTPGWTAADRPSLPESGASRFADQRYRHVRGFALLDWRTDEGFTGRGGTYRVEAHDYASSADALTSFRRLESEVIQLVPILRGNWVVAIRGVTTLTYTSRDHEVPLCLMPTLGGSDLRGFSTMRFRGPQRALMSGELRWTPAHLLDMAIFYEAGRVADRARDLTRGGLERSYGIGFRLHGQGGSTMRLDLAHSREHAVRVALGFGVTF